MITKTIQIDNISIDEITALIADKLLSKIVVYIDNYASKENDELLTRKETANYLKVTLSTLWSWSNKGLIKSCSIGNRVYYKKQDILESLEGFCTKKNKK